MNRLIRRSFLLYTKERQRRYAFRTGCLYDLILADEVTASLDPETAQQVMMNLLSLPCMVVAITHDQTGGFMKSMDRLYRVRAGVTAMEMS